MEPPQFLADTPFAVVEETVAIVAESGMGCLDMDLDLNKDLDLDLGTDKGMLAQRSSQFLVGRLHQEAAAAAQGQGDSGVAAQGMVQSR